MNIPKKIIQEVESDFETFESTYNVRILYAVESGSRAWGFASENSDYDIRFIYANTKDWYLSIKPGKDVIEKLDDVMDYSGWDLKKTLNLLYKCNPPLFEWLRSPIVYREDKRFIEKLRMLSENYFSPVSTLYHYLHMAEGNYKEFLNRKLVRIKKYFYVLRPVLACLWIEREGTIPPMEFITLLESQLKEKKTKSLVKDLLKRKMSGEELDKEAPIPEINLYLEEKINYFKKYIRTIKQERKKDIGILNDFFREIITS